jgi:hypothetical protein
MLRLSPHKPVTPIQNLIILMHKILLLLLLPLIRMMRLIQFNPHLPGKTKIKGKVRVRTRRNKNNNKKTEKPKTHPVDDKDKCKPRYPCLICGDDHYMKDCP